MLPISQIENRKLVSSGLVELRIFQVYTTHPAVLALEKCDQVVTDKSPSSGNEHLHHHLPPLSVSTISATSVAAGKLPSSTPLRIIQRSANACRGRSLAAKRGRFAKPGSALPRSAYESHPSGVIPGSGTP